MLLSPVRVGNVGALSQTQFSFRVMRFYEYGFFNSSFPNATFFNTVKFSSISNRCQETAPTKFIYVFFVRLQQLHLIQYFALLTKPVNDISNRLIPLLLFPCYLPWHQLLLQLLLPQLFGQFY